MSIGFTRGTDPKKTIGIGIAEDIKKALTEEHRELTNKEPRIKVEFNRDHVVVTISGSLVLKNGKAIEDKTPSMQISYDPPAAVTILDKLSISELYQRIKDHYTKIIEKCEGKSLEEQKDIIFGEEDEKGTVPRPLIEGEVEKSKPYILSMPESADDQDMDELVKLLNTHLEYATTSIDIHGVSVGIYRAALEEAINSEKKTPE